MYPVGGSSRYVSHQESHRQTAAPAPIIVPPPQTSSSSRFSEESHVSNSRQQPQYVPIEPATDSLRYSAQSEYVNSGRGNGAVYVPVYQPSSGSSHVFNEQSGLSHSGSANGGYVGRFGNYPQGGIVGGGQYRPTARLSTNIFDNHASSGLSTYMSESERLAKLQAQTVQGQGAYSGSSTVDSAFSQDSSLLSGTGGLGSGLGVGSSQGTGSNGGFIRTKSWENNSKWASGTQVYNIYFIYSIFFF